LPLLGEHERKLDDRGLGAGDDGNFRVGIELDAVVGSVPVGERLAQLRQAAKRRVSVNIRPLGAACQHLDNVRRRPGLRIPAPQIEERLAADRALSYDPC